jgi:leucyl/phenylalanyl-tRNA--protein transferase
MFNLLLKQAGMTRSRLAQQLALRRVTCLDKDSDTAFPPADTALRNPNGLIAIGGDLQPARLEQAYRQGIFPWYQPGESIRWWSPDPRSITIPGQFKPSKNLRRLIRRSDLRITFDQAFHEVVLACAAPRPNSTGTWISDEMIDAYCQLHERGNAHSIEVWQEGVLVGGQFGVSFGAAFFGESMFSRISNASKISFVYLSRQLYCWGYRLIDGQFPNAHMTSLGAITISRQDYLRRLEIALAQAGRSSPWRFDEDLDPLATASAKSIPQPAER